MSPLLLPFAVLFGTPLAALGVAAGAAAVPIVIHLLNRKRYRVTDWAAMRFLLAAQKRNVRRLRVEQWLLLAARTLLVLLLVLAMSSVMGWAEPLWQRLFPGGTAPGLAGGLRTHRVLVLDASFSMALRDEDGRTAFERAKQHAETLLQSANPGDGFSLIVMGAPAQAVVGRAADDRDKVLHELRALRLPHGGADLGGALNATAEVLRRSPEDKYGQREVYFLTDMQRATWSGPALTSGPRGTGTGEATGKPAEPSPPRAATGADAWQQVQRLAHLIFVDVGREGVDNLAVTNVTLGDPLVVAGALTSVTATVHNFGAVDRHDARVELLIGRARGDDASGGRDFTLNTERVDKLDVAAGAAANFTFQHTFREAGEYVVQVRLENDALPVDDERSIAVSVRQTVPVLLVNGNPTVEPARQATSWLVSALNPFPKNARNPAYPADPHVITEAQFADAALGDLSRYDCVFLCDVSQLSEPEVARLEAHLKKGGGVVVCLGPNVDLEAYNRLAYRNGDGILPGRLTGVVKTTRDRPFTLSADEDRFQLPPLDAFAADNARANLLSTPFRQYVRVEAPARGPARQVLSFLPPSDAKEGATPKAAPPAHLDPAVLEWQRYRGRVVLVTTAVNYDWSDWPSKLTFPPLMDQLMRLAILGPPRRTVGVGDVLEEFVPPGYADLPATVRTPDGRAESVTVARQDDAAVVHFGGTDQSGVYRVEIDGRPREFLFAVNVPAVNALNVAESDLRRTDPLDLKAAAPEASIQIVTEPGQIDRRAWKAMASPDEAAKPREETPALVRGPEVARWLLLAVLVLALSEMLLAWRFGAARSHGRGAEVAVGANGPRRPFRWGGLLFWPLGVCLLLALVLGHEAATGEFLHFLPAGWRQGIESGLGVSAATPGEGTRMRLQYQAYLSGDARTDRWLVGTLAVALLALVVVVYGRERRAARDRTDPTRPVGGPPVTLLGALRLALLVLTLAVLLPQLALSFEREGWPDVVILIDDSRSMSATDVYPDAALRERVAQLARLDGLSDPQRLQLAQALLTSGDSDWLTALLTRRQTNVHVYHCSNQVRKLAEVNEPGKVGEALRQIRELKATGESSQLGAAVRTVLNVFRGSSLSAIVMFTDGVTTEGEDLVQAARHAADAGVPLFFVGLGDAHEPLDLSIHDLAAADVVNVNDRLIFEAQVTARGLIEGTDAVVTLYEKKGDQRVELARVPVRLDPSGKPVKVRLAHKPTEAGEKVYIMEIPPQPGETETGNNRLERQVYVAEARKLRVLYVEGYPRYEFRFIKTLLERESDAQRGNKTVELKVLLTDADKDFAEEDKSAISRFPGREELFAYDAVILGDVDPNHRLLTEANQQLLSDFVREKGGGLLLMAGQQFNPHAYREGPLADLLPIRCDAEPPTAQPAGTPIATGYRPRLTAEGQSHPLFRFVTDEAENAAVWNKLAPLLWSAGGYRRKLTATALAVHPERTAPAPDSAGGKEAVEPLPLVLQQRYGAGRVLFFGFDETWRWRLREDEVRFNQFWVQVVRYLARNRIGRIDLRLDRQTSYRRGQPIRVTARLPEDGPPPDGPVQVLVERTPPRPAGGEPAVPEAQTVELAKVEGRPGTYEALLTRTPEGEYRFTLTSPLRGTIRPHVEGRVLPPPGEMDRLRLNQTDLERAAALSGTAEVRGKFYTLAEADQLLNDLPEGNRVVLNQPRPPWRLWNQPLMFGLWMGLLATEWVLRKRRNLL